MKDASKLPSGRKLQLHSGRKVDILNFTKDDVCLSSTAFALGYLNRFGGQAGTCSVAEHSLICADIMRKMGGSDDQVYEVLVHDAHEAVVGEVTSPMKHAMRQIAIYWARRSFMELCSDPMARFDEDDVDHPFDIIENKVMSAYREFFGLPMVGPPDIVHTVDVIVANGEGKRIKGGWDPIPDIPQPEVGVRMHPDDASAQWYDEVAKMMRERGLEAGL